MTNIDYKTSKDYKHLKELLEEGHHVVCFVTYDFNYLEKDSKDYTPLVTTDVCVARYYDKSKSYDFSVRGLGYGDYNPAFHKFTFEKLCESLKIEFIEPNMKED